MRRSVNFVAFCSAVLLLASAGCGGPTILPVKEGKKCELQIVSFSVVASPLINPTTDGQPRPVQMRIYQLKDDDSWGQQAWLQIVNSLRFLNNRFSKLPILRHFDQGQDVHVMIFANN